MLLMHKYSCSYPPFTVLRATSFSNLCGLRDNPITAAKQTSVRIAKFVKCRS